MCAAAARAPLIGVCRTCGHHFPAAHMAERCPSPGCDSKPTWYVAVAALTSDETVVMASGAIPHEWTIHGIHARATTRDVVRLAIEEAVRT